MKRISGLLLLLVVLVLASVPLAACNLELHSPVGLNAKNERKEEVASSQTLRACEIGADISAIPIMQKNLGVMYELDYTDGAYAKGFMEHPASLGIESRAFAKNIHAKVTGLFVIWHDEKLFHDHPAFWGIC